MRRARRPYDRQLSKYHAASSYRAIRRSMRVIMMETKFGGGACDCGVVPGLKILSGRRRGAGRPLNFRDEQVASIAEFPSVNQAIRACPARRRRRWARTGVRIPTPGSSIPSATAAGHPGSLREGRRCIRPPITEIVHECFKSWKRASLADLSPAQLARLCEVNQGAVSVALGHAHTWSSTPPHCPEVMRALDPVTAPQRVAAQPGANAAFLYGAARVAGGPFITKPGQSFGYVHDVDACRCRARRAKS